ncbi:MAG: DinB family protein [Nitrospinae bacterium]|nr:DinB family protein [Nitrospinota bacterium]
MPDTVCEVMASALRGKSTHVESVGAVSDLPATSAALRPAPGVHSPQEILSHMVYWQDLILQAVRGERVLWLERAAAGKADHPQDGDPSNWETLLARFQAGLLEAEHLALTANLERPLGNWGGGTVLNALSILAIHNAFHLGQMVMARQLVEHWPTPGGGDAG